MVVSVGASGHCGSPWQVDSIGSTSNFSLKVQGDLDTAQLVATNIVLNDVYGGQFVADVDLVWEAAGVVDSSKGKMIFQANDEQVIAVYKRLIRDASVRGHITLIPAPGPIGGDTITFELNEERVRYADMWEEMAILKIIPVGNH